MVESGTKKPNYKPVFAILGVVVFLAVLLTPMDAFTASSISFIDTELKSTDADERFLVDTKYPIGDEERLKEFPTSLGKWQMSHEYEWDSIAELLDTDVLLARDYRAPGIYIPVSMVIIQSSNMSSFHPAPLCYKAQGYTILDNETATVNVALNDTAWAKEGLFKGSDLRAFDGQLAAKRLVVERSASGGAVQRQINLYFYLKEEQGNVAHKVEWVRLSMFVPATGSYAMHEEILKQFMSEVVPELFAPAQAEPPKTLLQTILSQVAA